VSNEPPREKQSKLVQGTKFAAVAGFAEAMVAVVGILVLGAAYSVGWHMLSVVVAVPAAFLLCRRWLRGD
jgi:hypothetical protein